MATTTKSRKAAKKVEWALKGDWFDVCSCVLPCGCTFAQAPTDDFCSGILAWNIKRGHYGDIKLNGFTVIAITEVSGGNLWDPKADLEGNHYLLIDDRADERQREALLTIWKGDAGGWPAQFAKVVGRLTGHEYAPIEFSIEKDLSQWSVEVPGRIHGAAIALTGPTADPAKRVQTHNPPGSETNGSPATWAVPTADLIEDVPHMRRAKWTALSSKHIPFDWTND